MTSYQIVSCYSAFEVLVSSKDKWERHRFQTRKEAEAFVEMRKAGKLRHD